MRFLRLSEVRERVGLSRASLYRMMAAGKFPRQYNLTERSVAWLAEDVDSWIEGKVKAGQVGK